MSDAIDTFDKFVSTPHVDQPAWVNDYFAEIARGLERAHQITLVEPVHVEPFRKFDGLFVYADGVDFDPGRGRGVYYWDSVSISGNTPEGNWIFVGVAPGSVPGNTMNWRNTWVQDEYFKGDVVRDVEWLMIANTNTTDRAAPQPPAPAPRFLDPRTRARRPVALLRRNGSSIR